MAAALIDSDGDEMSDDEDDLQRMDDAMVVDPQGEDQSDLSSDDGDDSDNEEKGREGPRGVDKLQIAHGIDIPQGVNIPVVSQLAKEAYKREQKSKKAKTTEDM